MNSKAWCAAVHGGHKVEKDLAMLLTLDEGYLLTATLPDLQCGISPLGPPAPAQPQLFIATPGLGRGGVGYTEELYKKDLHNPDNHDGMITHLESDILECEVKWALGSITMNKASRGDGWNSS